MRRMWRRALACEVACVYARLSFRTVCCEVVIHVVAEVFGTVRGAHVGTGSLWTLTLMAPFLSEPPSLPLLPLPLASLLAPKATATKHATMVKRSIEESLYFLIGLERSSDQPKCWLRPITAAATVGAYNLTIAEDVQRLLEGGIRHLKEYSGSTE